MNNCITYDRDLDSMGKGCYHANNRQINHILKYSAKFQCYTRTLTKMTHYGLTSVLVRSMTIIVNWEK